MMLEVLIALHKEHVDGKISAFFLIQFQLLTFTMACRILTETPDNSLLLLDQIWIPHKQWK